jgi:hypothetical protein
MNQNLVWNGLGTLSVTIPIAGNQSFAGQIQLPTIVQGNGASSLVVTVKQNGTAIYTGTAGASGFKVDTYCAVGDVIAIIFSSSAAIDQGLNVIKSEISITQGE